MPVVYNGIRITYIRRTCMIENYLLKQFVVFAKCGTLSKASEELHISQPSLSRSMKKLEEEFGVSLFRRDNSKISLNETGKVAAEYAARALEANEEMIERVISFERNLRTVSVGACTPLPLNDLIPILQNRMPGKSLITEIANDTHLVKGLKDHRYDLVILHEKTNDRSLFQQRYMEENLYISIAENHPLAKKDQLSFSDLKDIRILTAGGTGFWLDTVREKLNSSDILVQDDPDVMDELVDASTLPVFNSNQAIRIGYETPGRVSIPISDQEAHAVYYITCLSASKTKFDSVFSAVRSTLLNG